MPKEKIFIGGGGTLPDGQESPFQYIEITWGRDMAHVDIAMVLYEAGDDVEVGRRQYHLDSWHMVNGLIGHLKRARDSAFGRPE